MQQVLTKDGSHTLFSEKYNQHYHNPNDGAIQESLYKHVIPALEYHEEKTELHILDICFGLGYNTLSTLYWLQENSTCKKLSFYSPELDSELIHSLKDFPYPKEFDSLKPIINALSQNYFYEDAKTRIEIFRGDAREYIKKLTCKVDIVYQDAFSSEVNKELWTKEYFSDIKNIMKKDAILTTYAVATPVRMGLHINSFYMYENKNECRLKLKLGEIFKQKCIFEFIKKID